jgi:hypothetical protein
MKPSLLLIALAASVPAAAQDPAPVYQAGQRYSFELKADGYLRQEWTDTITFIENDRTLARARPRVELGFNRVLLGLGGDFVYGSEKNTEFLPVLPLLRDNYDSRDARLDLAFVRVQVPGLRLDAGRFAMPVHFTEMVWDRDLRPQGAAATLEAKDRGPFKRLALTGLGARGSHVFPQDGGAFDFSNRETLWLASASALAGVGEHATIELTASYLTWSDLDHLDPRLRRQNTRASAGGPLARDYDVVDLVARFAREGRVGVQLAADFCRNTAVDDRNDGLWLAAVLGSTRTAKASLEYVFAKVDPDATLAAFAADDFLWETGWEGHRGDLGLRVHDHWALHVVAQRQRFKDAPRVEDRDVWFKRYRLELRFDY